ncbi:hypothetical protein AB0K74_10445 [Streptomyces sp. NPDC056159]|uniref:hypothetical protein n=1 Tax=unclassified Streptomyces TaxID=2593676 RepID=UPI00343C92EE
MSATPPQPAVVVEAGGEPWTRVGPLLDRRTAEITAAAVIEILTTDPSVRAALPAWCAHRDATLHPIGTTGFLVHLPARAH